ncbi:MAG: calcium-binding protein, partial [Actinomycetota bacterium]
MKQIARISATVALVAMVAAISGSAAAATPERKFTADFRDSSGVVIIPCVLTNSTNTLEFRITKVNKQGPPIREADITTSGFTGISGGTPTTNSGTWSSGTTGNVVSLDGHQLQKAGSWVQVGITATAPATVGVFQWTATADGPGSHDYSISGTQPLIHVVANHADCPPGTTPIPTPTGGATTQQSGAGTPCVSPTITGGAGDSLVIGTPGNDVILDLLGNNHVEGRGGNDTICTGPGNDVVLTLGGTDIAFDQGGNNLIRTEAGPDSITTGRGNSRIAAGTGADKVSVGSGTNSIRLGKGRDRATGDSGNDRVWGGRGKDTIAAADGKNRLNGGKG